jgi:hypothetical protein
LHGCQRHTYIYTADTFKQISGSPYSHSLVCILHSCHKRVCSLYIQYRLLRIIYTVVHAEPTADPRMGLESDILCIVVRLLIRKLDTSIPLEPTNAIIILSRLSSFTAPRHLVRFFKQSSKSSSSSSNFQLLQRPSPSSAYTLSPTTAGIVC